LIEESSWKSEFVAQKQRKIGLEGERRRRRKREKGLIEREK